MPDESYVGMRLWSKVVSWGKGAEDTRDCVELTLDWWHDRPARLCCRQYRTEVQYALTREELCALRAGIDRALSAHLPE